MFENGVGVRDVLFQDQGIIPRTTKGQGSTTEGPEYGDGEERRKVKRWFRIHEVGVLYGRKGTNMGVPKEYDKGVDFWKK